GYRIGYIGNVLRTMFLPAGADNEYRYRIGEDGQVSPEDIEKIKAEKGQPAVICFGDRYASNDGTPTYRFYPLRRGEVVDVTENGERLFIKVRMDSFLCAPSPHDYSAELYRLASRDNFNLLKYSGNPENDKDGRYVYP